MTRVPIKKENLKPILRSAGVCNRHDSLKVIAQTWVLAAEVQRARGPNGVAALPGPLVYVEVVFLLMRSRCLGWRRRS